MAWYVRYWAWRFYINIHCEWITTIKLINIISHSYHLFFFSNIYLFFDVDLYWVLCIQFSSVHSLSHVRLFATPWIAAHQASLSVTNSLNVLKLMSIESVMPSNHLILCHLLLLLSSIIPNIRVFSNESPLCMRWPKYWSFIFSINPSNEYLGLISFGIDWFDLPAVQGTLKRNNHP